MAIKKVVYEEKLMPCEWWNCYDYRFIKKFISSQKGKKAVADFIRTFMANDCFEMQFNVVDKKELLAAQENPEAYQTLLVRVRDIVIIL